MTHFYRYIRPLRFDEQRVELETAPHGGVCLRFDDGETGLIFTHARCHPDELFSKSVAKRVADQRFDTRLKSKILLPEVQPSKDTTTLVTSVIAACQAWDPVQVDLSTNFYVTYLKLELQELQHALALLVAGNRREQAKAEIWKAGIEAAHHGERYESLSR